MKKLHKDGRPVYYMTDNFYAARTSQVEAVRPGGDLGLSLTGMGVTLGIWDGDRVRDDHQEFINTGQSRVTLKDGSGTTGSHATHVAGTMAAGGIYPIAQGMAYQASLWAYSFFNDENEMASAALAGLLPSNHSYGTPEGWERGICVGQYDWCWNGTKN